METKHEHRVQAKKRKIEAFLRLIDSDSNIETEAPVCHTKCFVLNDVVDAVTKCFLISLKLLKLATSNLTTS